MRTTVMPFTAMLDWPLRRWIAAGLTALGTVLLIALPTALIPNPVFLRMIPAPWWAWPSLLISAVLAGLLFATYVAAPAAMPEDHNAVRGGWVGGALTYFAVGCPVCNKIVLLALGSAGAITWFEPVQPILQLLAIVLLAWALRHRLRGELACPVAASSSAESAHGGTGSSESIADTWATGRS